MQQLHQRQLVEAQLRPPPQRGQAAQAELAPVARLPATTSGSADTYAPAAGPVRSEIGGRSVDTVAVGSTYRRHVRNGRWSSGHTGASSACAAWPLCGGVQPELRQLPLVQL